MRPSPLLARDWDCTLTWILLRMARALALRALPGSRWRQFSVPFGAAILTLACLFSVAFVHASVEADARRAARMPVLVKLPSAGLVMVNRAEFWDGRQVPFVWIERGPGDLVLPPGLERLPRPGTVAISSAAASSGMVEGLGLRVSDVGSAPDGTIGREGLANASESLVYARPPAGRDLGEGGVFAGVGSFGPKVNEPTQRIETDDPHPGFRTALFGVLAFVVFPSLLLALSCTLASSDVRSLRNYQLARLGVQRRVLVGLNGTETAFLAVPGAALASLAWLLFGSQLTALPMSGIVLFPGDLALAPGVIAGIAAASILCLVVVGARPWQSMASLSASGQRVQVIRPPSPRALIPLVASVVMVVAARYLGGVWAVYILVLAFVPCAISLLVATPYVTSVLGARLTSSDRAEVWLASTRLKVNAGVFARSARVLAVLMFVAGASTAWLLAVGNATSEAHATAGPQAFSLGWRDSAPGDIALVREKLDGDLVAPLVEGRRPTALIRSCDDLARALGDPSACVNHELSEEVQANLTRALGISFEIRSEPAAAPRGTPQDVVIISTDSTEQEISAQLNRALPAVNLSSFQSVYLAPPLLRGWLLAAGVLATLLALVATLHSFGNQAFSQRDADRPLAALGFSSRQILRYRRWLYLLPFLVAIPLGLMVALMWGWAGQAVELASTSAILLGLEALAITAVTAGWVLIQLRLVRAR